MYSSLYLRAHAFAISIEICGLDFISNKSPAIVGDSFQLAHQAED